MWLLDQWAERHMQKRKRKVSLITWQVAANH